MRLQSLFIVTIMIGLNLNRGSADPISTPEVPKIVHQSHRISKHAKKHHKKHIVVLPIREIRNAVRLYIAKNEGNTNGLTFPGKPAQGECSAHEHCKYVYYLQNFLGPHGEVGGQAIVESTIIKPHLFSVITISAGASDTVEGFEAFDVPESAAKELLR